MPNQIPNYKPKRPNRNTRQTTRVLERVIFGTEDIFSPEIHDEELAIGDSGINLLGDATPEEAVERIYEGSNPEDITYLEHIIDRDSESI